GQGKLKHRLPAALHAVLEVDVLVVAAKAQRLHCARGAFEWLDSVGGHDPSCVGRPRLRPARRGPAAAPRTPKALSPHVPREQRTTGTLPTPDRRWPGKSRRDSTLTLERCRGEVVVNSGRRDRCGGHGRL